MPPWVRPALALAPLAVVLLFHTLPATIDQQRRKRLKEISGELKPGYFRLAPRDEEKDFTRADNKHEEIFRWLKAWREPVLYLTGQSGSGKSSILAAWVLPRLSKEEPPIKVIQLRGYQDPLSTLISKLRQPGIIWSRLPEIYDVRQLLERACRQIRPQRLLVVFDQFEEFVILHGETQRQQFESLLASLVQNPIDGLTVLLVLRSDYVGILEKLALPKLFQDTNWKEVPPFTESAAGMFLRGSNLQVSESVLRDVLREAAEIEQAKGLIRPVTLNLCGLVLGRFSTGLPRDFRPGRLLRGFLRETVQLPSIREVTPKLIPALITSNVTKRPRTVAELAQETGLEEAAVRGCFRVLGQADRGIVRPLDREQNTWEISHDFLVPLLDAILARWSVSLWRRTRPFLPWIVAGSMALAVIAISIRPKDPIRELTELGWQVTPEQNDAATFRLSGKPRWRDSAQALRRLQHRSIGVALTEIDSLTGIELLRDLKSLTSLDLSYSQVTDLQPLRDLKSLISLDLRGTHVTDPHTLEVLKQRGVEISTKAF